jgi:hypothetical protein
MIVLNETVKQIIFIFAEYLIVSIFIIIIGNLIYKLLLPIAKKKSVLNNHISIAGIGLEIRKEAEDLNSLLLCLEKDLINVREQKIINTKRGE